MHNFSCIVLSPLAVLASDGEFLQGRSGCRQCRVGQDGVAACRNIRLHYCFIFNGYSRSVPSSNDRNDYTYFLQLPRPENYLTS
jgi:hypothetical protein